MLFWAGWNNSACIIVYLFVVTGFALSYVWCTYTSSLEVQLHCSDCCVLCLFIQTVNYHFYVNSVFLHWCCQKRGCLSSVIHESIELFWIKFEINSKCVNWGCSLDAVVSTVGIGCDKGLKNYVIFSWNYAISNVGLCDQKLQIMQCPFTCKMKWKGLKSCLPPGNCSKVRWLIRFVCMSKTTAPSLLWCDATICDCQ